MTTVKQIITVDFPEAGRTIKASVVRPHQAQTGDLIDRSHNADTCLRPLTKPIPRGRWEVGQAVKTTKQ